MPEPSKSNSRGARRTQQPGRAWQRMLSGRRLDILDPSPMDVEIIDIAHGLARVSRWNGQTKGLYPMSVAQHSVMVERFVSQNAPKLDTRWRLAALLHDAPEYVIGDMITPFKYALGGSTARSNHTSPRRSTSGLACLPFCRNPCPRPSSAPTGWRHGWRQHSLRGSARKMPRRYCNARAARRMSSGCGPCHRNRRQTCF